MNLEERLLRTVEKEAQLQARGSMSIFDVIGTEQIIRGAARGNVSGVAEGAASFATGKARKLLMSKNRATRLLFRAAKASHELKGSPRLSEPVLPTLPEQLPAPKLFTDPSTGKVRSAADYSRGK